ncbi:hypothetical protein VE02_08424 [Pseudogymnoascus sp. 03VT05]|nr:hypothetical protein VE02_08424 [Pseudogymnoascus sp. 03VT05]
MAESGGPAPGAVEEQIALPVPSPSDAQQLPELTAGEGPKDGAELPIAAADDNGPSDPPPPQATTTDASHTTPSPVTLPPTSTPLQPTPPVHAIPTLTPTFATLTTPLDTLPEIPVPIPAPIPPPSLTSTHSHPTTSISLSSTFPPASNPPASLSTSPSSTDTQTLTSARAALEATILSTGTAYTHPIEARARDLHAMNTALATQQTQLLSATGALAKENDRLAKLAEEGDAEGVADRDGEVEWRCRECALREDLEAMVGELGGFVDDEMDTSGEITVEPPRGEVVHDAGGETVMEEARDWKGKGVAYPQDENVNMEAEGAVAGGEEVE